MQETTPRAARERADELLARYCALLDEDRLEDWCGLFSDNASYTILSRENVAQGLPGAILLLENRAMIADRITALREAAVYNIHYARHLYSGVRAEAAADGSVRFDANFSVYQTDNDGHTRLFCVGRYQGWIGTNPLAPILFQSVVLDTFCVPTLLAVPV